MFRLNFIIGLLFLQAIGILTNNSNENDISLNGFNSMEESDGCPWCRDCAEILDAYPSLRYQNGVYTIHPIPGLPVRAFCDMETDGGGWTVIQRRGSPLRRGERRQDFFLDWKEYEEGFGDPESDYWLGLAAISALTRLQDSEIVLDFGAWNGARRFANYKIFQVAGSSDKYKLTVGEYSGNSGDSLGLHNGCIFGTKDRDVGTCANRYHGAWWYRNCHRSNLNGLYAGEFTDGRTVDYGVGIIWQTWLGYNYSLRETTMRIRSKVWRNQRRAPNLGNI